ncbi:MAG TPA: twin-arginine translocase subunit TatC [Candidatus Paceibacterota bacterium]|nr:twin-arginine translocase subunit TatC [Verrucomicrobiota bacterium]HSA12920.1 twin-arginine translocase subunit TatC [Candidatus Paceibacterota bacterium]
MADEPVAEHIDEQEEEEGGPIKSFLEHLEDLRWVLIKSCAAAGVAMLVCLLGGNYVIGVLEWPLRQAPALHTSRTQTVKVFLGTNQLSVLHPATNDPLASLVGTNRSVRLELVPGVQGTNQIMAWRVQPDAESRAEPGLGIQIINLSPAGSFIVATKVAFFGGLVLASPFIFYFVAHFVFPALRMREKKYVYRGLIFGLGLFAIGVCFCYFILMPIALAASVQYAEWLGFSATQWRAEDYVSFVCKFMLGMGIGFELPVVVLTLVKIGVLNYRMLAGGRRYVIVISAVLGAVLTTPEVITQVLMAIPLYLLYETCIWIAWYWERKEKQREVAAAAGDAVTGT